MTDAEEEAILLEAYRPIFNEMDRIIIDELGSATDERGHPVTRCPSCGFWYQGPGDLSEFHVCRDSQDPKTVSEAQNDDL